MTDIIVYTTPLKLLHKQGKLDNDSDYSATGDYYWDFGGRLPKDFKEGEKIFFATKGFIRGYFVVDEISQDKQILFNSDSWNDIELIPIKHFQGFKYKGE